MLLLKRDVPSELPKWSFGWRHGITFAEKGLVKIEPVRALLAARWTFRRARLFGLDFSKGLLSLTLSIYDSIYLSISLSIYLSMYLSNYLLSMYLPICLCITLSVYLLPRNLYWTLLRLPRNLYLTLRKCCACQECCTKPEPDLAKELRRPRNLH